MPSPFTLQVAVPSRASILYTYTTLVLFLGARVKRAVAGKGYPGASQRRRDQTLRLVGLAVFRPGDDAST